MNKDSKIFVAGGTGMVGSAIIRKLIEKGYTNIISNYHTRPPVTHHPSPVTYYPLELTHQLDTEKFFESHRPEYIFLAAAKVGGILANETYKAQFIYENIAIASNIIHASYKYGIKKLLNLGSSCIYPKLAPQPMKEEYLLTGPLEPTNEPYAIAKIAAIKLCRYYNEQYSTNFISVMPTNLYGPNDNFNLETSHVLPALIRKFHLAKLLEKGDFKTIRSDLKKYSIGFGLDEKVDFSDHNSVLQILTHLGIRLLNPNKTSLENRTMNNVIITLWGTGEVYREFLYVDDLANACVYFMENINAWDLCASHPLYKACHQSLIARYLNLPDYFINIGTGEDLTIRELAYIIKGIVGFTGEIQHDRTKPDGMPKKLLDVNKMEELGWQQKISLEEGIRKTYRWYVE